MGQFELIDPDEEQFPLVAFRLAADEGYDEFDIAWQLSAERGWMVPAYTLPPNAQDMTIMRALVKETMSREHVDTLARDIEEACATLEKKGGAHESERQQMEMGPVTRVPSITRLSGGGHIGHELAPGHRTDPARGGPRSAQLPAAAGDGDAGEGAWVTDDDGHRYLDMLAAYSALNFGHRHPDLVAAARSSSTG